MTHSFCFGIDIGGTNTKIGLFTLSGKLVSRRIYGTERNAGNAFASISFAAGSMLSENNIGKESVKGAGLCVPGPVDCDGVLQKAVNLGWDRVDVKAVFEKLSGLYTKVENDANAAALGEFYSGAGKGEESLYMLTVGTGIGGAFVYNGRLLRGAFGAAGEVGHIQLEPEEKERCSCGSCGCAEQYASAEGIKRLYKNECLRAGKFPFCNTAEEVFKADSLGDDAAVRSVEKACSCLGRLIAIIDKVVDPDVFILGGGVSSAGEGFRRRVKEHYLKNCFGSKKEIRLAKLSGDAGMYGCAYLIKNDNGRD